MCGILAGPPAALALEPDAPLARQETHRDAQEHGVSGGFAGNLVEETIRSLLDTLDQLFHGPGTPNEPDGGKGDQGASIDPSGHRMSKH